MPSLGFMFGLIVFIVATLLSCIAHGYEIEHSGKFWDLKCNWDEILRPFVLYKVEGKLLIASLALDSGLVVYILILHTIHMAMESNTLLHFVLSGQGGPLL